VPLTSPGLLAALVVGASVLPVAAVLGWRRLPGGPVAAALQRLALVLTCQLLAVLAVAAALNDDFGFYTSWQDLRTSITGQAAGVVAGASPVPVVSDGRSGRGSWGSESGSDAGVGPWLRAVVPARSSPNLRLGLPAAPLAPGASGYRMLRVTFSGSGLRTPAVVLLPPQYFDPALARARFPVLLAFNGYPGTTGPWLAQLHLPDTLATLTPPRGQLPYVAVLLEQNVVPPRDTECTDVPGGPQVAAFLGQQVPARLFADLRLRTDRAGWATIGYSTGGFCAAKLALLYPHLFGEAASLAGYYTALQDGTTGDLYGSERYRALNSPVWRVQHLPIPDVSLLVMTTRQDGESYVLSEQFLRVVRPPLRVSALVLPQGGHNFGVWSAVLPDVLRWLQARAAPLRAA
jgi:S-formylglutathione hydrolase FrmB